MQRGSVPDVRLQSNYFGVQCLLLEVAQDGMVVLGGLRSCVHMGTLVLGKGKEDFQEASETKGYFNLLREGI